MECRRFHQFVNELEGNLFPTSPKVGELTLLKSIYVDCRSSPDSLSGSDTQGFRENETSMDIHFFGFRFKKETRLHMKVTWEQV